MRLRASYRHFWLAEDTDSWGRTKLQDSSGDTKSYLGQHLELRARWDVVPGNLRIEFGGIFLQAENLSDNNSIFAYAGAAFTF